MDGNVDGTPEQDANADVHLAVADISSVCAHTADCISGLVYSYRNWKLLYYI